MCMGEIEDSLQDREGEEVPREEDMDGCLDDIAGEGHSYLRVGGWEGGREGRIEGGREGGTDQGREGSREGGRENVVIIQCHLLTYFYLPANHADCLSPRLEKHDISPIHPIAPV